MRRIVTFTLCLLLLTCLPLNVAWGQSSGAHFQRNSVVASVDSTSGALTVSFTEAGLGNLDVNYTLNATGTATYACLNGGGNHPKAANKETVSSNLSGGATFTPQNGKVTGSITLDAPSAGSFSCPSGQTLVLANVSYTNVVLTDTSNSVSTTNIRGSFSATLIPGL
jgi:hypothetical protein